MTFTAKSLFIILICFLCSGLRAKTWDFADHIGGPNNETGSQVAIDSAGNFYVVGSFSGWSAFGSSTLWTQGASNVYIAKYSATGSLLWTAVPALASDSMSHVHAYGIAIDGGSNIYIAGSYEGNAMLSHSAHTSVSASDVYLMKLDGNGTALWTRTAGGVALGSFYKDAAYALALDAHANCYVTGSYNKQITFDTVHLSSTQTSELFVAKYDSSGEVIWAKTGTGGGIHFVNSIAATNDGAVTIAGAYFENIAIDGFSVDAGDAESKMFLARLNSNGVTQWVERIGTGGYYGSANDVTVESDGSAYITGFFRAGMDIAGHHFAHDHFPYLYGLLVAKFDLAGNAQWATTTDGADQSCQGNRIALDAEGNAFVTGHYNGTTAFGNVQLSRNAGNAAFLAKLDTAGVFTSTQSVEGNGNSIGYGLALHGNRPVLLGEFTDTIAIGTQLLVSTGLSDVFVAALDGEEAAVQFPTPEQVAICYPNPVNTILHLTTRQDGALTDVLGRTVLRCNGLDELNVEHLPPGTYLLNGYRIAVRH